MIETLGIRWIELLAQSISFSFVLFVLWKLAYKPVFNMLEARTAENRRGHRQRRKNQGGARARPRPRARNLARGRRPGEQDHRRGARSRRPRDAKWKRKRPSPPPSRSSPRRAKPPRRTRAAMLAELKREVGRLVVQTTTTVTGKVLTPEDQRRLAEETQKQICT